MSPRNSVLDRPGSVPGSGKESQPTVLLLKSQAHLLSFAAPLAAFFFMVLLVRPWGNYPLNDDWIYARILQKFLQTGKFVIDPDAGAAFIGQALIASPIVRIFGFSHTNLRLLTIFVSSLLLFIVWWLLSYAGVRPRIKALALFLLASNPLFASLSMTFMTDMYGYTVALLGVVWWFSGRWAADRRDSAAVISWTAAIGSAVVIGTSFWIRQYCVMAYPALVGAALFRIWRDDWRRLTASIPRVVVSSAVLGMVIAGYFVFARHAAVVPMLDFSSRLGRALSFSPVTGLMIDTVGAGIFLTYMTLFFLPFLVVFPLPASWRTLLPAGGILAALGVISAVTMAHVPASAVDLHRQFPYLDHTIYNAGIGPLTTPDLKMLRLPARPRWPEGVWTAIQYLLLALNVLWAAIFSRSRQVLREAKQSREGEIIVFGSLFACAFLAVTMQFDRLAIFDRYYFPELLALILVVSVALGRPVAGRSEVPATPRGLTWRFAVAALPLAFFTTAGLHDYFRWNDVRWQLFENALNHGVSPLNLQAGYEPNGWAGYAALRRKETPPGCIGPCHCEQGWYCPDDSYRIGMNVYGNYEVIASRRPDYWLAPGPPIYLSRRKLPTQ